MKRILIFICTFFVIFSAKTQVLELPEVTQEQNEWCWAGVSKCVLDYYGDVFTQCEIAEYARSRITWYDFGNVPCCEDASFGCNNPNYNCGMNGSIEDILSHFGEIVTNNLDRLLSKAEIEAQISQNRPFIMQWAWIAGGAHFLVGQGLIDNNFYYMDPWFGEGYSVSTYDYVCSSSKHFWNQTQTMTSSPTGTSLVELDANFQIYPNPVFNELKINNYSGQEDQNVQILDIAGRLLMNNIQLPTNNSIDVSSLPEGIYFVKIGKFVEKFIKQ
jgi:hypothetical protein